MTNKADVSMCMIVKNDHFLEKSILSFRDYVKELVIVDTGSTDDTTIKIAQKYADIFEVYKDCNDPNSGLIEDFSMARQRSFDLATKKWVMWCDSDDLIEGAQNLSNIIEEFEKSKPDLDGAVYLFPYEYAYNESGQCILLHYRERLFYNKNCFRWVNPVHEVVIPKDNLRISHTPKESLVWKHNRQFTSKVIEPGRNLRILKKYYEKVGDTDARQLYYLGLEYCNAGMIKESIYHLSKYIEISGWEDERVMACLKLVDIYKALGNLDEGIKWAFKAIEIKEDWSEGYFALSILFYLLACKGGPNEMRNWQKCVFFAKTGLNLPPTKTLLFINPLDRECEIHKYLNVALNKLGDVQGALDSVITGMKKQPNDQFFVPNKKLYEEFLSKQKIVENVNILKQIGTLNQTTVDTISALINNQKIVNDENISNSDWKIPNTLDLESLPINITEEKLLSLVIMLWKQYMLYDEAPNAIKFLENVPPSVRHANSISQALKLTKDFLYKDSTNLISIDTKNISVEKNKLDIVFFAGDGVETWTPATVEKTGIGGSELMLLELAKRLALLGHKVRVYNSCGENSGKIYDGVEYYQTNNFKNITCDILIVSRIASALADTYNINATVKLLWVHDIFPIAATNELLLKADRILALSEWHKQFLISNNNISPDHIITTRNGIDLKRFEKKINRNRFKCINSNSPDRSWAVLLDVWSSVKQQVPQAELHLYYGFKNWKFSAQNDFKQLNLINYLENKINEMKSMDVVFHDRIDQKQLAEEFLSAGCWVHPTWFSETSCITAMEAQAAGVRMVTSNIAALKETAGSRAVLIDGDWTSPKYQEEFIQNVVKMLMNADNSDRDILQKYAKENFSLDSLAQKWNDMFYRLIDELKTNPIVSYYPTAQYRNA